MKKILFTALALMLMVQVNAQPNIENYPNPEEIPLDSYAVPYGESGEWLIIKPGYLTEILEAHNDGTSVNWNAVLEEVQVLPQVGDVASLTNLLSNYIPNDSDYTYGPKICCRYIDINGNCMACWSYWCGSCWTQCWGIPPTIPTN
ncbi:MAG: hypothetical protein AB8B56_13180 [Crocinitomicaceae bacterium]